MVADLCAALGGEPEALEIVRPSLEDVYLSFVEGEDAAEQLRQAMQKRVYFVVARLRGIV